MYTCVVTSNVIKTSPTDVGSSACKFKCNIKVAIFDVYLTIKKITITNNIPNQLQKNEVNYTEQEATHE